MFFLSYALFRKYKAEVDQFLIFSFKNNFDFLPSENFYMIQTINQIIKSKCILINKMSYIYNSKIENK